MPLRAPLRLLAAAAVLAAIGPAAAQPAGREAPLAGRVLAGDSGQPVAGAFVSAGSGAVEVSAESDADGRFALDGLPPGEVALVVVADGYAPATLLLDGRSVTVTLEPSGQAAGEIIEVKGVELDDGTEATYGLDAEQVTRMPGSGNDALKSLQSLPGVGRVPFGLGGLVLRGSSPRDSNVYIDGIEVPILYHFGGIASVVPAASIEKLELTPSGFGAEHGRSIGGLVTVTGAPGRSDRWRIASEVSLIDAQLRADGPGAAGGTWSLGLRRSYVDAILALALPDDGDFDLTLAPRYYDAQLRYDLERGRDRFTAMLLGADDRLAFAQGGDDGLDYQSSFVRVGLRWQRRIDTAVLTVLPWIGLDRVSLAVDDSFVTRDAVPMGLRASVFRGTDRGYVAGGVDVQGGRYAYDALTDRPGGPDEMQIPRRGVDWYGDTALWLEGNRRWDGGRLGLTPGLRVERFGLTGEWVVEPRLTARHALHPRFQLEESIGLYHQPPSPADVDPVTGNPDLGASRAIQASVGARVAVAEGTTAKVTTYYNDLDDLPADAVSTATPYSSSGSPRSGGVASASRELTAEQFGSYAYQENGGRGRNYGVEVLVERSRGRFFGWVAYTYGRAFRRDDPRMRPEYLPYVLDQPHVLTALGSVALGKWTLGARLRYATGNPYTPAMGATYDAEADEYTPIDGPLLSQRLPAFAQLDLRVDRTWAGRNGDWSVFLDLQNATNRLNPEGVDYDEAYMERSYTRGLPIFPSIGVAYRPR